VESWAIADVDDSSDCLKYIVGNGLPIFRHAPTGWVYVTTGSSFSCSELPQAVFKAFLIQCEH